MPKKSLTCEHGHVGGRANRCTPCHNEYHRAWVYGLSVDQLRELLARGCEVCGSRKGLNVDHDHKCCKGPRSCGKCVRGVLCGKHNRLLARVRDDANVLRALADYLDH